MESDDSKTIFILGLCVLGGWMLVILICASPHLFRNYLKRWFKDEEDLVAQKIRLAEVRLQQTLKLAHKPSTFLVDQAITMTTIQSGTSSTYLDRLEEVEDEEEDQVAQSSS